MCYLYVCMFWGVFLGKNNNMHESHEAEILQCIYRSEKNNLFALE